MKLELKIKDRVASLKLVKRQGNIVTVSIDGKNFEVDLVKLDQGIYSAIYQGKSYNVEMVNGNSNKIYLVNTFYHSYQVEIIDAESKEVRGRCKGVKDGILRIKSIRYELRDHRASIDTVFDRNIPDRLGSVVSDRCLDNFCIGKVESRYRRGD